MHNRKSFRTTWKEAAGQPWIATFLSSLSSLRHVSIWVWYKIYQIITVTAEEMFKHSYSAYQEKGTGSIPSQSVRYLCWITQQWDSFSPVSISPTMLRTHPFINHGRYIFWATDSIVTVTLKKKDCHTYVYSCVLKMFGKGQLPHYLSVPIFYIVLLLVSPSKSAWGHIGFINTVAYSTVSFKK